MIIIEASHINVGGSLVLLEYLLKSLDCKKIETTVYLKYDHVLDKINSLNLTHLVVIKTSTLKTICRYMQNRSNVLYFCSLPPFSNSRSVLVYFHSEYYSQKFKWDSKNKNIAENVKSFVYYYWIYQGRKKAVFYCQADLIAKKLRDTYGIDAVICPFFELSSSTSNSIRQKKYDFIYPALDSIHKNHQRLLSAVKLLRSKRNFSIMLTIPKSNRLLTNLIEDINREYPGTVVNRGVLKKEEVLDMYALSRALIYPSCMESLGLPLVEGIYNNLCILSSDLNYSYNAIDPPIVFNPYDDMDIARVMNDFLDNKFVQIDQVSKMDDNIDVLIKALIAH